MAVNLFSPPLYSSNMSAKDNLPDFLCLLQYAVFRSLFLQNSNSRGLFMARRLLGRLKKIHSYISFPLDPTQCAAATKFSDFSYQFSYCADSYSQPIVCCTIDLVSVFFQCLLFASLGGVKLCAFKQNLVFYSFFNNSLLDP